MQSGKIKKVFAWRYGLCRLFIEIAFVLFENIGQSLIVAVSDTGSGIAESGFKELFSKFRQLGNKSNTGIKGTGLGLAIVKGIVEEHGGTVGAVSQVGVGSVFYFVLPL